MTRHRPGSFRRADRVAEAIQAEIAEMLEFRIKDPRIGFVTLTGVDVTDDLRYARVYFSVVGDEAARAATQEGLASAAGFIQRELGRRLRLRFTPIVEFRFDPSLERGARIEQLLKTVRAESAPPADQAPGRRPAGGPDETPGGGEGRGGPAGPGA